MKGMVKVEEIRVLELGGGEISNKVSLKVQQIKKEMNLMLAGVQSRVNEGWHFRGH